MQTWVTVLTGVLVAIGLVGVLVPVLPGLLLVWAAVSVWALVEQGKPAYVLLVAGTAVALGRVGKGVHRGHRSAAARVSPAR